MFRFMQLIKKLSNPYFVVFYNKYEFNQLRFMTKIANISDVNKIRNIGIIAHIDAGKTTTTERMLYYSGFTQYMGEVHEGDTVMDYMVQERERGITITSASITFKWNKHRINLIDTPGHVDFTFEVERSLSVLDGAIVILDSSAGVEVQTVKVWDQAQRYEVPCIVYLNKMDKPTSDIDLCLMSLEKKLKVKPLLLHLPVGLGKKFKGVVDLISEQKFLWNNMNTKSDGRTFVIEKLNLESEQDLYSSMFQKREMLIENIADLDEVTGEKYITEGAQALSVPELYAAIRRITLNKAAVPVLCGSSYKNIAVQLLMDAIVNYLPNPLERKCSFLKNDDDFSGIVFKIIHNKNKEPLTFLRIYSNSLKAGQRIYNKTRQSAEKIGKLMVALANDFQEVPSLSAGNIAVVTGLKETITGDLLFSSPSAAAATGSGMPCIQIPDPVFFCTIEPPSVGMQKQLDFALHCLQREDPTFRVEVDETIGQTILMGMGELHIDIIKERIRTEYDIDAYLGPLQVAYRESIEKGVEHMHVLDKTVSGNKQFAKIVLRIYPSQKESLKEIKVIVTKDNNLGKIRSDFLKAVNAGMRNALSNGPILNFPVLYVGVDLLWLEVSKGTSMTMLSGATSQCISAALRKSNGILLEPVMNLSIVISKGFAGRVLNDLSQKRSQILNMELRHDVEIIQSRTPLSELRGYSTHLRALTSGMCSFTMEFDSYQKMDVNEQARAIGNITGF
ncbi:ribosome-releasing factor 2, mitochondrial-like [Stegodyphus dumicola]|uniref:ribosome-releasing factor 2, mitochondrial-like n=1 Tax=Stegodyphus dumicola TaxID=202533 RepID=UPI0015B318CA|nr:ribosome-releasing factor 2, mitochondrial-like [Stegodyphus dumicola]